MGRIRDQRMKKSPASIERNANASAQQTRADSANAPATFFHSKPTEKQATKEKTMKTIRGSRFNGSKIIAAIVKASPRMVFKIRKHGWKISWCGNGLFGIRKLS